MNWYLEVLKKYAVFKGRSRRREYWTFTLVTLGVFFLLALVEGMVSGDPDHIPVLAYIFGVATFLPQLAVLVRRLHDRGLNEWWVLIAFVPLIGALVLLGFVLGDSERGENRYGPNPKGVSV